MRNVPPSPEPGHFTSTILWTGGGTCSSGRSPLVSSKRVYPRASKRSISGSSSRSCSMGSPPVNSTKPEGASLSTSCSTSMVDILLPPVNVYSLSHHEHRRLHAEAERRHKERPQKT